MRSPSVDWLVVGLGNPGAQYASTPHNAGFLVADELARRWELPRPKAKFAGRLTDGRTGPGGPRVAVLWPQTFMNDAGRRAGPARGALGVDLDRVLVVHDEIDLPFGDVRSRLGGGLAGHNGLQSLQARARVAGLRSACASASGGRTRPTPTSSPRTCSAAGARGRRGARLVARAADRAEAIVRGEVVLASGT